MKLQKLLSLCCLSLFLLGCNSKSNDEIKITNALLVEENNQLKLEIGNLKKSISEIEKENEDLKSKFKDFVVDLDDKNLYEVHKLESSLFFENNGYSTKVYQTPKIDKSIYVIQKGDFVDVSKFIHVKQRNKNFIKVKINKELEGYIQISGNPYKNGNFEVSEKIDVNGIETTILKMEKNFTVDDGIYIKALPSDDSENIHEITHEEGGSYHKSLLITSDYEWTNMQIGNFSGWVHSKNLGVGRGGPVLNTPEQYIYFDLIGGNEI